MEEKTNELYVQMLGDFVLTWGGESLPCASRMKKIWLLIAYLLLNRDHATAPETLMPILWNAEECDDGSNSLKNLVYRTRNYLKKWMGRDDVILSVDGGYQWNAAMACRVDCEEMEQLLRESRGQQDSERRPALEKALEGYRGCFIPRMDAFSYWIGERRKYYTAVWREIVLQLAGIYRKEKLWQPMIKLSDMVAEFDPYQHEFHSLILETLQENGYHRQALKYYQKIQNIYGAEEVPARLTELCQSIAKESGEVELNLNRLQEELQLSDRMFGAFYCEYPIFQNICNLQRRLLQRQDTRFYLGLVSLTDINDHVIHGDILPQAMEAVQEILVLELRSGDVITRYGESAFALLLVMQEQQQGSVVSSRLEKRFRAQYPAMPVKLHFQFQQFAVRQQD